MRLSVLRQRIKLAIPNIGQLGITDAFITTLLNQACNEANLIVKAYSGHTEFDVVANQREYNLSLVAPSYLGRDKRGCFFNVSGEWQKVEPLTEACLSEFNRNYMNSTPVSIPQYYYIIGNTFGFEPAADSSQVKGVHLFHLKRAVDMTNEDHYPFSGTTEEITALLPMDEAILAWVKWQITPAYGTVTDIDLGERKFMNACMRAEREIKSSPDASMSSFARMRR